VDPALLFLIVEQEMFAAARAEIAERAKKEGEETYLAS
jgi:hypothetical protein